MGFHLLLTPSANAALLESQFENAFLLDNAPDYDWWYGCSPTSAGMMMGYYDINGYAGLSYDNLVPGGTAELSSFGNSSALVNNIIASQGHISDFYYKGYGASDDDIEPPFHEFNSLADFMGTSQDYYVMNDKNETVNVGNVNGGTSFWYYGDGSPLYADDIFSEGSLYYDRSGMYGIWEYFNYAGYGIGTPISDLYLFNQYTDNLEHTYGFSFDDYMHEIDAGRVVMLHVQGHSMFGYGYDSISKTVYLHDTWSEGEKSMIWGGTYPYGDQGLKMYGVTCFEPIGGSPIVPIPATIILFGSGLIGLLKIRKKAKIGLIRL